MRARRLGRRVWQRRYRLPIDGVAGGRRGGNHIGSSVGYYIPAYINAVRWSYQGHPEGSRWSRVAIANLLAVRSLTVEFGLAEFVDRLIIRPTLYYATPVLNHVLWGWILGGFAADSDRRWTTHRSGPRP